MYERSYGAKYDRKLYGADVSKAIRADIKAQVKAGNLPGGDVRYSVRLQKYSGGYSINISVKNLLEVWEPCDGFAVQSPEQEALYGKRSCQNYWCEEGRGRGKVGAEPHDRMSWEGVRVEQLLKDIANAYNYDGSESQVDYFDVNFYVHVNIQNLRDALWELQEKDRLAAAKAAREAKAAAL